jgi:hypothetical protein
MKCTCGIGDVFYSHLHEKGCPVADDPAMKAPEDPKDKLIRSLDEITKPCPFCGTPARVEDGEHEANSKVMFEPNPRVVNGETYGYCVTCIMCGARGPESKTEEEAVSEWNHAKWIGWAGGQA